MNNADMPASPSGLVQKRRVNQNDPGSDFAVMSFSEPKNRGMTKRETFAMAAMQGLLASDINANLHQSDCVHIAVAHADALLAELDKEQSQ